MRRLKWIGFVRLVYGVCVSIYGYADALILVSTRDSRLFARLLGRMRGIPALPHEITVNDVVPAYR